MNTDELLAEVERLRPLEHAPDAEANRRLSPVVYDAMYRPVLFGTLASHARGGREVHPVAYSFPAHII
jgi:hypothetical protein